MIRSIAQRAADWPWLDRCFTARDRALASAAFQRWASAFPLTRFVARRRARALFDLCAGFVYAQILYACVKLELFHALAGEPQTAQALAPRLRLSPDATVRLLAAAAALRLVEPRGQGRFGLGTLGAALAGNPGLAAMIEHHALLYADLADPVALLRSEPGHTRLAAYWPYAGASRPAELPPEQVGSYTDLMAASQAFIAQEVLGAYPFERHRRVLDIGGGDGAFLAAAVARVGHLQGTLFDLPAVAKRARCRFAARRLDDRTTAVGGDFFSESLPPGADLVTLIRVVHDHDDAAALALLRAARRALPPDGILLVAEPMAETTGAESVGAYFAFYLLAMGSGRPRSFEELAELLKTAGFGQVRRVGTRMPLLTSIIIASPAQL